MRRLLLLCSCTSTFPEAKHHTREPNDTQTHTKSTPVKQIANSQMQKNAQQDETHETCKKTVNLTFRHSKISEFDTSPNQNSVQDGCGCPFWLWPSRRIQHIHIYEYISNYIYIYIWPRAFTSYCKALNKTGPRIAGAPYIYTTDPLPDPPFTNVLEHHIYI